MKQEHHVLVLEGLILFILHILFKDISIKLNEKLHCWAKSTDYDNHTIGILKSESIFVGHILNEESSFDYFCQSSEENLSVIIDETP